MSDIVLKFWHYGGIMRYLYIVLVAIACYLIGNINFAIIISKLKKRDIRKEDSGNPGAMNMLRNYGTLFGGLTLLLDAFKGAFAALLGWFLLGRLGFAGDFNISGLSGDQLGAFIGGAAAVIGHIYPALLKFKGGKGIASTIGVCFVINPLVTLITLGAGVAFIAITKVGSIASFIIIAFPLAFKCYDIAVSTNLVRSDCEKWAAIALMMIVFLLTLWAHRKNLKKLFLGTERKTSIFSKYKSKENSKKSSRTEV